MITLDMLKEACRHKPTALTLEQLQSIPQYNYTRLDLYPDPFMFSFGSYMKAVTVAEVFAARNGLAVMFSPSQRLFTFYKAK